jgi:hypothetical protein
MKLTDIQINELIAGKEKEIAKAKETISKSVGQWCCDEVIEGLLKSQTLWEEFNALHDYMTPAQINRYNDAVESCIYTQVAIAVRKSNPALARAFDETQPKTK